MKNLTDKLNHAIMESQVEYLKYSLEEMRNDYDSLNSASMAEKKAIGAKYHSESKKAAELKETILMQLREERKTRKEYTVEDVRWFYRQHDSNMPDTYKALAPWLEAESIDFVVFLKDYIWKRLEKSKLTDKVRWSKGEWTYGTSYADRSVMTRFLSVEQFILDHDPKEISSKADKQSLIDSIVAKLQMQMVEFKEAFLKSARDYAARVYDNAPKNIEKYEESIKKYNDKLEELKKHYTENGEHYYWRHWDYKDAEADRDKAKRDMNGLKAMLKKYTKDQFIKATEEDALDRFNHNVLALADKINEKELNIAMLQVSNVRDDPKIFQMLITDGEKKLFARSILAAEFSDKMIPHFRFIITNRKNG